MLAPPPEHLAMRSITTMKFFTFQFELHDLSVPLSASIFLNLLLIHIFIEIFRLTGLFKNFSTG